MNTPGLCGWVRLGAGTVVVVVGATRRGTVVVVVVVVVVVGVTVVLIGPATPTVGLGATVGAVLVATGRAAAGGAVAPVVTRPTLSPAWLTNHSAPSGPGAIPIGVLIEGSGKTVKTPEGVTRPTEPPVAFVNHRFPSPPAAMAAGYDRPGSVNVATTPPVVIRPIEGRSGALGVS
jgi:hypothetical protein